jgi:hypothetical protein
MVRAYFFQLKAGGVWQSGTLDCSSTRDGGSFSCFVPDKGRQHQWNVKASSLGIPLVVPPIVICLGSASVSGPHYPFIAPSPPSENFPHKWRISVPCIGVKSRVGKSLSLTMPADPRQKRQPCRRAQDKHLFDDLCPRRVKLKCNPAKAKYCDGMAPPLR